MKKKLMTWSILFMLCITCTLNSWAQQPKKPRIQSSASPEEILYKPLGQKNESKPASQKKKVPAKKMNRKSKTSQHLSSRYCALKTNILADAFAIHNLAVEVQIHSNISVELPVYWSLWDFEQEHGIRGIALQPEARWWTDQVGKGHYVGLHAHAAWYNVKWNENRYQDTGRPLMGAGLSYGYKLPLGAHWGAEFTLGVGYTNLKYNVYYNVDNGAKINSRIRHYWGVTRIGASLVYHF